MWYQEHLEGVLLKVKVIPGSKQNKIAGIYPSASLRAGGDFLKVKIAAPPEKGKANEMLCKFLANKFDISVKSVRVVKGQTQSLKIVFVPVGVDRLLSIIKLRF